jgi:hypothetical protein
VHRRSGTGRAAHVRRRELMRIEHGRRGGGRVEGWIGHGVRWGRVGVGHRRAATARRRHSAAAGSGAER